MSIFVYIFAEIRSRSKIEEKFLKRKNQYTKK